LNNKNIKSNVVEIITKRLESYEFQVGMVDSDERVKANGNGFKNYRGKIAHTKSASKFYGDMTVKQMMAKTNEKYKILSKPFTKNSKERYKVLHEILKDLGVNQKTDEQKLKKNVQDCVIKPIVNEEYGHDRPRTQIRKGFSWLLVNTGQMLDNVKAKIIKK
jgi:hypothetical protein